MSFFPDSLYVINIKVLSTTAPELSITIIRFELHIAHKNVKSIWRCNNCHFIAMAQDFDGDNLLKIVHVAASDCYVRKTLTNLSICCAKNSKHVQSWFSWWPRISLGNRLLLEVTCGSGSGIMYIFFFRLWFMDLWLMCILYDFHVCIMHHV